MFTRKGLLITAESPERKTLDTSHLWEWEDFRVRDRKTGKMVKQRRKRRRR